LTLAWFAAANLIASAVTWPLAAALRRRSSHRVTRSRAQVLVAVRLLPAVVSVVLALGLFLPEHWASEAREGSEEFGAVLWALAMVGAALLGASVWRVSKALHSCRRLRQSWSGGSTGDGCIVNDVSLPGISLAGILKTSVVVGRPVREALTGQELEVALAHELAHRDARDNVKRFAMFASPDFLGYTGAGRQLERQWSADAECLADAQAVRGDSSRAALLASALVKVARLAGAATAGRTPDVPLWSTFYQSALLEMRVRRLVGGPVVLPAASRIVPVAAFAAVSALVIAAWAENLPRLMHFTTEALVRLLP
jgi:hypothetical protein